MLHLYTSPIRFLFYFLCIFAFDLLILFGVLFREKNALSAEPYGLFPVPVLLCVLLQGYPAAFWELVLHWYSGSSTTAMGTYTTSSFKVWCFQGGRVHVVILHILFCFSPVARILSFQKELYCLFYSLRERISTRIYITFLIFILMYICVYVVSVCGYVQMCEGAHRVQRYWIPPGTGIIDYCKLSSVSTGNKTRVH